MTRTITHFPNDISGEWHEHVVASTPVLNPSTGDIIAECRLP